MDNADSGEWLIYAADWLDRFLTFWHEYRILAFGVLVGCLTLTLTTRALVGGSQRDQKTGNDGAAAVVAAPASAPLARSAAAKGPPVAEKSAAASLKTSAVTSSSKTRPVKVVAGRRPGTNPKRRANGSDSSAAAVDHLKLKPLVFYASLTGTTERLAKHVVTQLRRLSESGSGNNNSSSSSSSSSSGGGSGSGSGSGRVLEPELHDLSYIDLDDYFITGPKVGAGAEAEAAANNDNGQTASPPTASPFYVVLVPSYDIDTILNNFLAHLDETHNDFRIDTAPLSKLAGYSVFGVGDKDGWPSEQQAFCYQAIEVDRWMAKLTGRKRAYPLGMGNVKHNVDKSLEEWISGLCDAINDIAATGTLGAGVPGSGNANESDDDDDDNNNDEDDDDDSNDDKGGVAKAVQADFPDGGRRKRQKTSQSTTIDLEDMGGGAKGRKKKAVRLATDWTGYSPGSSTTATAVPAAAAALKAMVPKESPTHAALSKQGYTIVGSHSGVKICRWTKSALRGRGSCYKNSFYGIASHLCMEATPSLSCSNKCVFCWRHGTNPVSTTWRWQVDDPQMIFDGAKEGHYKKIKMMRGVPGVRSERFQEAMRIRHCALSLVGEPIFYPRINEFVGLLHSERISSFLVCNAQHPQQLQSLERVTQLYVSIDASNRDSLRKIDRPLHRDFWERFNHCLDILREKRWIQRTVFRLTLVKGFNVEDEAEGYADLVAKGLPCFVEIKGVTYCGTSTAAGAGLTMANVPFYHEVVQFVLALNSALAKRGLQYGIAAEHEHSCCILLASNRFYINHRWHTLIDYERFFDLLEDPDRRHSFSPEDYCKPTPEWALWGNGGFDPRDERVDRKGRKKEVK